MTHGHELRQGCQTHFHQGPHEAHSCLQRAEIILGLYKCNYFLTVKELKLWWEGECKAEGNKGGRKIGQL